MNPIEENRMYPRSRFATLALALLVSLPALAQDDGVIRVRSAYPMQETVARLKADVTAKGIMHFADIDQAQLAAAAGIKLRPSTLLIFGNPPLGTLFISAKAEAGLDWPVRLLVTQDEQGQVWAVYTDFKWIAARHGIRDRDAEFATATGVIASITSTIRQ
jgi:uncharacterized protein (DUF302 family)